MCVWLASYASFRLVTESNHIVEECGWPDYCCTSQQIEFLLGGVWIVLSPAHVHLWQEMIWWTKLDSVVLLPNMVRTNGIARALLVTYHFSTNFASFVWEPNIFGAGVLQDVWGVARLCWLPRHLLAQEIWLWFTRSFFPHERVGSGHETRVWKALHTLWARAPFWGIDEMFSLLTQVYTAASESRKCMLRLTDNLFPCCTIWE